MRNNRFTFLMGLVLAVSLAGPAPAEGTAHSGYGMVKSVDAAAGKITIDHEDIPGLMMGMTMEFSVSDPDMLEKVVPEQMVDFRVRYKEGRYIVTEIRPSSRNQGATGHDRMEPHGCGAQCARSSRTLGSMSCAHGMARSM